MSTQPMTRDGVRRSERRGTEPDARAVAEAVESIRLDPTEEREQVRGYAVIGVPLEHGDVLAMRRFPASSIGPGYTSVWHRSPDGRWTIYQDQDPLAACPRAFGPALDAAVETEIGLDWSGPGEFAMRIDEPVELRWQVRLAATAVTRTLSAIASATPSSVRRSRLFAELAARATGIAVGAGKLRLTGTVPSGQAFHADMRQILLVADTHATIDGRDLGRPAPLDVQDHLGDFWIPRRGLFAFGDGLFEPYDPDRHELAATRHEAARATDPAPSTATRTADRRERSAISVARYAAALDQFEERLRAVPEPAWGSRTRCCPDWDVADLVDHVVDETSWAGSLLAGFDPATAEERSARGAGAPPVERWEVAASDVRRVLAADDLPSRVRLSDGEMATHDYLAEVCCDTMIHTWDLADATSGDVHLDPDLVDACSRWFDSVEDEWRARGAIGPPAPVSTDADAQARLLARFGRSS